MGNRVNGRGREMPEFMFSFISDNCYYFFQKKKKKLQMTANTY